MVMVGLRLFQWPCFPGVDRGSICVYPILRTIDYRYLNAKSRFYYVGFHLH